MIHAEEIFGEQPKPQIPSTLEEFEELVRDCDLIEAGQDVLNTQREEQHWPEPEELGEELPPVPPFDVSLLPASLRPMVEDVTDRMQTPPDFAVK